MDGRPGQGPDVEPADLAALREARVVWVTGKGGTGKTSAAAAVARVLAASGRRVCLCEVDSQRPAMTALFGHAPTFAPEEVLPRLWVMNVTWPESLVAYLRTMVPVGRVVKAILANETVKRFLDFTPGSREIVTLTVLQELLRRFDVVVVDMPASGHAFSMLDITRSALGLFRGGPVRQRVESLRDLLRADTTHMVVVALPEEMVVNETLETVERLRDAQLVSRPPIVLLNRALPPSLAPPERILLDRLAAMSLDGASEELVEAGRWDRSREDATEDAVARISRGTKRAPVLIAPAGAEDDPAATARHIAVHLGRLLGIGRQELTWT